MPKKKKITLSLERFERLVRKNRERAISLFKEHADSGKTIVADAFLKLIVQRGRLDVEHAAEVARIARKGIRVQTGRRRPLEAEEYRKVLNQCR